MDVRNHQGQNPSGKAQTFDAQIGDENFEFHSVGFEDRKITGAQVVEAAGLHPVEDYIVLQQLGNLEVESIRPTEIVDLVDKGVERFFVIKGDRTLRFVVDGLSMEWPREIVTGLTVKRLVGKDAHEIELVLERIKTADKVIEDEDEVRLGQSGVEVFRTRRVKVTIVVNTRERPWNKRRISFEELIAIAYPAPPTGTCIVYTVTYFDGPRNRPEGTLTAGESVKVVDRMAFSVKFTDKS